VDEYLITESLEELADIVEVLYALAEVHGHSVFDLGRLRRRKLFERGGFVNRICLEYVGD
jgi:predicted house-cleaning noncanonical NTP pyrophosphatase (MazG superfamily)